MSERERALPPGWAWALLEDLSAVESNSMTDGPFGSNLKSEHYRPQGIRVVRLGNIGIGRFVDEDKVYLDPERLTDLAKHQCFEGDLLIAALADPVGRCTFVPGDLGPAIVKADCIRMKPHESIDSRYLMHCLNSPEGLARTATASHGIGRLRINLGELKSIRVPVAPADEQRRIVAKLDDLLARSRRAKQALAEIPALLERYRQSALTQEIGASNHRRVPLRTVISSLDQGWSPQCESEPSTSSDEWAVIKTTAVQPLRFSDMENKRLPDGFAPRSHLEVRAGDVLITRAGPRARAGICCHVSSSRPRLMICDKVYRLRTGDVLLPEYLALTLNEPSALRKIDALKSGISESGVNLTQQKLLDLEIPLPNLNEQRATVTRLESAFERTRAFESITETLELDLLRGDEAVLTRAFRGELVPQDPADEPASVLLDRLRAERATAPTAPRRRGREKRP